MDLRYPVGRFDINEEITEQDRLRLVEQIAETPARMREAVEGLSAEQLDTPYRPEGWTVRQVAHHVPDSHLNAYIRTKLALTEDEPTIKPYKEDRWAELADTIQTPVEVSLVLLDALHKRWVTLLGSLEPEDFARRLRHPELGLLTIEQIVSLYGWHGRHHVAHVTSLRERMGWK
jgi:DinB family protein